MRVLKVGAFLSIIGVALAAGSLAGLVVWVYRRPHQLIGGTFNEDPYPFDWPPETDGVGPDWSRQVLAQYGPNGMPAPW